MEPLSLVAVALTGVAVRVIFRRAGIHVRGYTQIMRERALHESRVILLEKMPADGVLCCGAHDEILIALAAAKPGSGGNAGRSGREGDL